MSKHAYVKHELLSIGYRLYGNLISDKIEPEFFKTAAVMVLVYGLTTWSLTKCLEKKLNGNNTSMVSDFLKEILEAIPDKIAVV